MIEIWKDIPDYKGLYQVSNLGRVKSLKFGKTKILNAGINTGGYYYVLISKKSIRKNVTVHKLVAITFLNHIPNGMNSVIDHINDNKLDNKVENLQIVSQRYNAHKTQGNYSSNYKGVSFHKISKKWMSCININKKQTYLGLFENEYEAHLSYEKALKELVNQ